MSTVVPLANFRKEKEQAKQDAILTSKADSTIAKAMMLEDPVYENGSISMIVPHINEVLVRVETLAGHKFEKTGIENLLKALTKMPSTHKVLGNGILRLELDGDYWFDVYHSLPENFVGKLSELLKSEEEVNYLRKKMFMHKLRSF